jgi:CPA2 family monovalent cation:H+ antiporter-2
MTADPVFFRDLTLVLVAAVLGGGLAWVTRQPLILGYVLGGILVSPLTPGPALSDVHTFELFAEIGVVLLMFSIGIEFSLRDLLRVKWVALLGGPLGILLSVGLGLAVGKIAGWPPLQGLVVGIVVSVASTMVLARLLFDRGELHTRHGRIMIGITLVEDLAVVILIVLMPALGAMETDRLLTIGKALGKAAIILAPFAWLANSVVPRLFRQVAGTRSQELFLLVTLAVGVGTAVLTQVLGLSLALGAFLAGLLISESDYAHETLARVLPLRDVFGAFFFVTVGTLVDPRLLVANLQLLGAMVGMILLGKLLLWTGVVCLFRFPIWTALLVGTGLTQIGEFSFILIREARAAGHVGQEVYNATLAAALLTILINAALVRWVPRWVGRLRLSDQAPLPSSASHEQALEGHVVVCGFGRVGSAVGEALESFGVRYTVIETDPEIVKGLRSRKLPCLFGDAAQRTLLEVAGAGRAALVILTLPEMDRSRLAILHARALNPTVPILARAHQEAEREVLQAAGATEVIQPEVEAAATLIHHAMLRLSLPEERTEAYVTRFRDAMGLRLTPEISGQTGLPVVRELTLQLGGLTDQSLSDARIRERFGVTVVAITRADGTVVVNPPAETLMRPGDRLRLFGLPEQIEAFLAEAGRKDDVASGPVERKDT